MNGIEDRLRDAFGAHAETVRPRAGAYAEHTRRLRRARARRRVAAPAAALATAGVAVAATLPAALHGGEQDALNTAGTPGGLVDRSTVVTIPGTVAGGAAFRPDALGADGSVIGRTPDRRVWAAGPRSPKPRYLGSKAEGGLSAGPGFTTWITPDSWQLTCRTSGGAVRRIGPQGTTPAQPVLASGGMVVANDPMEQPWEARTKGCADTGRSTANRLGTTLGVARAFAYPTMFVVEPSQKRVLREIDVRTDRVVREHPLPTGVRPVPPPPSMEVPRGGHSTSTPLTATETPSAPEQKWQAAANGRYFAWAAEGRLRIVERAGWKNQREVVRRDGGRDGAAASLTAGDRVIAYAAGRGSTVYDTEARRVHAWDGQVLAAGGWLLWREGADYRLGRVR
ncbi:hypothetical protein [Actinomadura chibensis]|uniref:Uncharacterized protein n=1 Tax=Actinomadura chibensis TaxID=392828 RepID=A0A5D0NJT5_9ACTN|nr:hypothetical protein [Actinomadura chibensis]TYB44697.1 hypothetical protein FXF69_21325 [Actinomadura chibensis]